MISIKKSNNSWKKSIILRMVWILIYHKSKYKFTSKFKSQVHSIPENLWYLEKRHTECLLQNCGRKHNQKKFKWSIQKKSLTYRIKNGQLRLEHAQWWLSWLFLLSICLFSKKLCQKLCNSRRFSRKQNKFWDLTSNKTSDSQEWVLLLRGKR